MFVTEMISQHYTMSPYHPRASYVIAVYLESLSSGAIILLVQRLPLLYLYLVAYPPRAVL